MHRLLYYAQYLDTPSAEMGAEEDRRLREQVESADQANLISSKTAIEGCHLPVLDLDHANLESVLGVIRHAIGPEAAKRTRFIASRTEGHFHAYIDDPVTWQDLVLLMEELLEAGLIEANYVGVSIKRGETFVRKPIDPEIPF